jgi:hypothetical protein
MASSTCWKAAFGTPASMSTSRTVSSPACRLVDDVGFDRAGLPVQEVLAA